ncbi:aminotransferase class IV [Salinibacterium soli]|uniref:Aminotransferase class IV n=1 Tax=Antiquaquibacter soli TaxID=3064523 RepID=A0ABT9BMF8_9MICO|nr:aminotransferase class IV [Protaetiibacter sp. WY-16]MDO7882216.1 aminotransferase class IV [Protaetiibacter sp. WY-16]
MSVQSIYRWHEGVLDPLEYCDMTLTVVEAADSWLVSDGLVLGIDLHRSRFAAAVPVELEHEFEQFWDAALGLIPREGDWFPRVELHSRGGARQFVFRLRTAPERSRTAVLATWGGDDPRTVPTVKGPDLERLQGVRTAAQGRGATEAVILSPDGYVVEGAYSALLWWRGNILCGPPAEFARVDSVTARSVLTLAAALGIETFDEAVTPAELDGTELWVLSALHGIRIATSWVDGPALAELPGRLESWRSRMSALRRPL